MKYKKTLAFIATLILSHFLAYPVGHWYDKTYSAGGSWVSIGPFDGYLDGLLSSYIILSSLILPIVGAKIKYGFYFAAPVIVFSIWLVGWNFQLWMDLILLGLGLGLAWVILFIRSKTPPAPAK